MKHDLKINSEYFLSVKEGLKDFEIRRNDRDFKVGDIVILNEYFNETGIYSGEKIAVKIKYITDFKQQSNYIVFGFDKV